MNFPAADTRCGFCGHPFIAHPAAASVIAPTLSEQPGIMWPCGTEGCDCDDFAMPGSVLELGEISNN
jgi:hypothetical protein